jgi:hypothetical protein
MVIMTTVDTPDTANFAPTKSSSTLDQMPLGSRCRIEAVDETSDSLLRLMEMGLTPESRSPSSEPLPWK